MKILKQEERRYWFVAERSDVLREVIGSVLCQDVAAAHLIALAVRQNDVVAR